MQAKPKMHLTLDQTLDQIMKAKCHPNIDKMQDEATYIVQPNVKLVSEL